MRYFVTGATGFVGGYLTSQLLAAGHDVTALVRTPEQARDISRYGVTPHVGTVMDKESMRPGVRGVDGVFHVAGHRLSFRSHAVGLEVNVTGSRNVFELVREHAIPRCVYTSGLNVYGDTRGESVDESCGRPETYPTQHDAVRGAAYFESAVPLMRDGVPIIALMPGMVYGPRDSSAMAELLARAMVGKVRFVTTGAAYCWAHVMDVAHAHVLAMQFGQPGASYIVGGPAHPVAEAIGVVAEAAGRRRRPLGVPPAVVAPAAAVVGALSKVIPAWRPRADRLRIAAGVTYLGDDTRARSELGFAPRPLAEGLPDAARAILEGMLAEADD